MCLSLSNILSDVVDETVSKSDFVLKEAAGNIMRKETWQTGIFGIIFENQETSSCTVSVDSYALTQFCT